MTKKTRSWFIVCVNSILTVFLILLTNLLSAQAPDAGTHWRQALLAARQHDFVQAVAELDAAKGMGLTDSLVFYHRGRWNFQAGRIDESMQDFDRYVELAPARANSQWERGITCYYAGKYREGAKQFVDYQNFHDNDVENAVWRYLCQIQFDGLEKARQAILPIKNDRRVPMMEIYRLFRGESTPDKVLQVLADSRSTGELARHEAFDAHLYLALFFDAQKDWPSATRHVDLAVKQFDKGDYMWSVAVQHQRHLRKQQQKTNKAPAGNASSAKSPDAGKDAQDGTNSKPEPEQSPETPRP